MRFFLLLFAYVSERGGPEEGSIGDKLVGTLHVSCMLLRSVDNEGKSHSSSPDVVFLHCLLVFEEKYHSHTSRHSFSWTYSINLYSMDLTTKRIKNEPTR